MTRCIYVGEEIDYTGLRQFFRYGITGRAEPCPTIHRASKFIPDHGGGESFYVMTKDLYFPSKQQTRHCPKK